MHAHDQGAWRHEHVFGQDQRNPGERRTLMVVLLTAIMMVIEITSGVIYGSMALLADGLHMASHTAALGIAVFAYVIARHLTVMATTMIMTTITITTCAAPTYTCSLTR
jgi:Co/Zn/Cd efflux system component